MNPDRFRLVTFCGPFLARRRFMLLRAFIVVAVRLVAIAANQRAYPRRLAAHDVERVEICDLYIELSAGMFVEQAEGLLGCRIPVAVYRSAAAPDPA